MMRSLLIKFAMLTAAALLIVWIGWPPSQDSESDSGRPAAQTLPGLSESPDGNQAGPPTTARIPSRQHLTQDHGLVDLNRASLEQLEQLPGLGHVLAQRVVLWRDTHGRFRSVDELAKVKGIGVKKLARIKPLVRVGAAKAAAGDRG
ncbi:MAG TPA: ComEA family DNA-binding protein [Nitrospiraceae bacterium]|nr:ComEA family DNA-binding protein [Nitrospiraceae bacterium]